jgi:hypothetical protein
MAGCNSCSEGGQYFFGRTVKRKSTVRRKSPARRKSPVRRKTVKRKGPVKKKVPKGYYLRKKVKSPFTKVVKDKRKRIVGTRLSARALFNRHGKGVVGHSFPVLQKDGRYVMKVIRLRQNGSPYFANKFGNSYSNYFGDKHKNSSCTSPNITHLNFKLANNWLKGPKYDDMTGLLDTWPNYGRNIPPGGVAQPYKTSLLPRMYPGKASRGHAFGRGHMHFGSNRMCFGA